MKINASTLDAIINVTHNDICPTGKNQLSRMFLEFSEAHAHLFGLSILPVMIFA